MGARFTSLKAAHGFQTLVDETEVYYMISKAHAPESSKGYRWNDRAFNIAWPLPEAPLISPRDAALPLM